MKDRRLIPSADRENESPLPRVAGAALLIELLGETESCWLMDFLSTTHERVFASDESFLRWLDEERHRDPRMVERLRRVLATHRQEAYRLVASRSTRPADG